MANSRRVDLNRPIEPGAVLRLHGERYTLRETDVIDSVSAVRRR